jgi:hypothetical protein
MPHININQKVKTTSKSPKHDDFDVQLIFVVFRRRFCDLSVQKWAISTWLINCFTSSMVAKLTHNYNTTQNTTHILNNNKQNEPSPYPQQLNPSLSMSRAAAPPNLGAASPYGSIAGARHWVCGRDGRFPCLK